MNVPTARGRNQHAMKLFNEKLVFDLITKHGSVSRRQLAASTRLTPSTLTNIVNALMRLGLVVETGTSDSGSSGGKPSVLLSPTSHMCVIGAELDTNHGLIMAAVSLSGGVRVRQRVPVVGTGAALVDSIAERLAAFRMRVEVNDVKILGAGLGVPGLIDRNLGVWRASTPYEVSNIPIAQELEKRLACGVHVDRRARLMLQAESRYGVCQGLKNVCFLLVDLHNARIGAGIMVDGHLLVGRREAVGEISHLILDQSSGPTCEQYGHQGCLYALLSQHGVQTGLGRREVIREVGRWVGIAASNLAATVSPDRFVVSVRPSAATDDLLESMTQAIRPNVFSDDLGPGYLVRSGLGEDVGVLGAASGVVAVVLEDDSLSLKRWLA